MATLTRSACTKTICSHSSSPAALRHSMHIRHFSAGQRMGKWMKGSDERASKKAWYGEARRFLEYEKYTLYSFDAHLRTTVDSYDKAGAIRRLMRRGMRYFNKEADEHQKKMVDESRQLLAVLDTFPREAFDEPDRYFRGTAASKLAMETRMNTQDIYAILEKFKNQEQTHKVLKERVAKGEELPATAGDMQLSLALPKNVVRTMQQNQTFGRHNPDKTNPVYEQYIEEWSQKVWLSPYRLRQGYDWKATWNRKDWRVYQPKWESQPDLDFTPDEYQNGKQKKLWPEDYGRQERVKFTKPWWMKRYAWKQLYDKIITERNKHKTGAEGFVDLYNYDRFRSSLDKTPMRDRITVAPKYGGNVRGYKH